MSHVPDLLVLAVTCCLVLPEVGIESNLHSIWTLLTLEPTVHVYAAIHHAQHAQHLFWIKAHKPVLYISRQAPYAVFENRKTPLPQTNFDILWGPNRQLPRSWIPRRCLFQMERMEQLRTRVVWCKMCPLRAFPRD